jgi:hypothetical protein
MRDIPRLLPVVFGICGILENPSIPLIVCPFFLQNRAVVLVKSLVNLDLGLMNR